MFDVPFLYGSGWTADADREHQPLIVLSKALNDKLFGGANSTGQTVRWNGRNFGALPADRDCRRRDDPGRSPLTSLQRSGMNEN